MSRTAVVLLANGTEEIEAITPGDVLNRCGVDVTYAGVGGTELMGGHHVPLRAECEVEDLGEILFDAVIVPGGGKGAENIAHSDGARALIKRHFEGGKVIAAICAAPAVVLAPLGVLNGKHATCYPGMERRFGPEIKACESEVVVDGHVITSRGPGTAMAFSLRIAEQLVGAPTALKVGQGMLVHGM
jgi:4-methyl-5(b-hydroxyethyl)-thiazole monophosphate biosynthesis